MSLSIQAYHCTRKKYYKMLRKKVNSYYLMRRYNHLFKHAKSLSIEHAKYSFEVSDVNNLSILF